MQYESLFLPIRIGRLALRNRVIMGALGNDTCDPDQTAGVRACDYYAERAKGGVALIINETTRVTDEAHGCMGARQTSAASDRMIPSLKRIADAVHAHGAALFIQLHHPGRQGYDGNRLCYTPSGVQSPVVKAPCHTMTVEEIRKMVLCFVEAAERCQKAGVDGVELHAAHGYLLNQFLSPHTNQRTDEYGGCTENRCRFVAEIIEGIRARLGDYPIMLRLSADEFLDRSAFPLMGTDQWLTLEESVQICTKLEDCGVDAFNISAGVYETANVAWEPANYPEGWKLYLAERIKQAVHVPVFCAGTIRSPEVAAKAIETGMVDGVTIARGLVADPEWVRKVQENRTEDIRKCISCLNCMETLGQSPGLRCSVNARATNEWEFSNLRNDGAGRRVVVIGGGPGGLESARVLALRGFAVTLLEAKGALGGQLLLANKAPGKQKVNWFVSYQTTQLQKLGVDIQLRVKADAELVERMDPYAVFVATGAEAIRPAGIPGIHGENVCTAPDILSGKCCCAGECIAVIGSGMTGMETAEYLLAGGNRILLVDMLDEIAGGCYWQNVVEIKRALDAAGTQFYPGCKLLEIRPDGVLLESRGIRQELPCDRVVLSLGVSANTALAESLEARLPRVKRIGDVRHPGKIWQAVTAAYREAYLL